MGHKTFHVVADYLARRDEVDPGRVGIAGHSEGGRITLIVASWDGTARFIIFLAGRR